MKGPLLRTSQHVINEGPVDIFTTRAYEVEQSIVILNVVPVVNQAFINHFPVTGLTQHHEPAHNRYGFAPLTGRHRCFLIRSTKTCNSSVPSPL